MDQLNREESGHLVSNVYRWSLNGKALTDRFGLVRQPSNPQTLSPTVLSFFGAGRLNRNPRGREHRYCID